MESKPYRDDSAERYHDSPPKEPRQSFDSVTSVSSTSAVLEHIHDYEHEGTNGTGMEMRETKPLMGDERDDEEMAKFRRPAEQTPSKTTRMVVWALCGFALAGWLIALFLFLKNGTYLHKSTKPHDPQATMTPGSGKPVTLDSVLQGHWTPASRSVAWIAGNNGEDGLILERSPSTGEGYLVTKDVRSLKPATTTTTHDTKVLMKTGWFQAGGRVVVPSKEDPAPDLSKVLVTSDVARNWRHSTTATYWIFDVETQTGEPLDPAHPDDRIQLATWSPASDAIVFTKENNMYLRHLNSTDVTQITTDGGEELFYGVPDWVYEEEVFAGASSTWWSDDGGYIAFLRTNETGVPSYPVQYYIQRPSGTEPEPGMENYPETVEIKYPKAGAHNPVVNIKFYDVRKGETFDVAIENDYADDDRLITEVVWAGAEGKVLVRETNRDSDTLKIVLIDVARRSGQTVRTEDVNALDGGWFEVSETTTYVPSDPANGRANSGYIDTVIRNGYDHLAYFTPLESNDPIYLTGGKWEVTKAPSSVDLVNNLVYFVSTVKSPIMRTVSYVGLDGKGMKHLTDLDEEAYYDVSFSSGSGFALLSYRGPDIPHQEIVSTPSLSGKKFSTTLEENKALAKLASEHELPLLVYSTVEVDGFTLQAMERRPPHFDPKRQYPVLFFLYGGPGSQRVARRFDVSFQEHIASALGYVVVTVDGRGTGFSGRAHRVAVRGHIGELEAHDQIAAAREWVARPYIDAERTAIWGWSYGGFLTLKTLEMDAGATFKYGMAVAPVTDWRYYDSVYTERYMHTPQANAAGYDASAVTNATALGGCVRFLLQHGTGDDNVHVQNSLALLDELDLAGVQNYDFHAYPDSDHSIYFHNAWPMVYGRLENWLINAFNGEWLRVNDAKPLKDVDLNGA